jgi:hypothetical protein
MAKTPAKNSIILIGGYNYSTYGTAYEGAHDNGMIDVTGFTDGGQNFIPGMPSAKLSINMLWDTTATVGAAAVLRAFPSGHVTIIPEGYALGNPSISMPYTLGNYSPQGKPDGALELGSLNFATNGGTNVGIENGWALAHGTITNTTTGTGFVDPAGAHVHGICGATLHIWTACAADTYVVKVQHCATIGGVYADLVTFTANGSAITSERQVIATGQIEAYRRVLATRTGAAGNPFGFTVHFWHLGVI